MLRRVVYLELTNLEKACGGCMSVEHSPAGCRCDFRFRLVGRIEAWLSFEYLTYRSSSLHQQLNHSLILIRFLISMQPRSVYQQDRNEVETEPVLMQHPS
jgi:hypothetical protein